MKTVLKLGTSLFLGFSFIFFVSPIFLYWFIHGDSNRYVWIINGPYPFWWWTISALDGNRVTNCRSFMSCDIALRIIFHEKTRRKL